MIDIKKYYILLSCFAVVSACNNTTSQQAGIPAPTAAQAPKTMAPFRYQKTIEVSPGQYYDILAWGRGSERMGAFQILRSDSAAMKYTTTTGDLEGKIVDVLNSDMDTDGNPEIFIHTQAADSTNAATMFAFEYNNDKARNLDFPKLTRSQRKGYRGNDNFFIKDGNLMREFDVYDENDTLAKKPIQKRLIEYKLRGNSLSSNQVSTDSTGKEPATSGTAPAEKPRSETRSVANRPKSRNESSHKRSSSRKSSTKGTKKKRRR